MRYLPVLRDKPREPRRHRRARLPAQAELFGFDPHATTRRTDPDTSHEAAAVTNRRISETCRCVLMAMRLLGPACDEELQAFYDAHRGTYGWPRHRCVRKRRWDLCDHGYAEFTGRKVPNAVGLNCREWAATDKAWVGIEPRSAP